MTSWWKERRRDPILCPWDCKPEVRSNRPREQLQPVSHSKNLQFGHLKLVMNQGMRKINPTASLLKSPLQTSSHLEDVEKNPSVRDTLFPLHLPGFLKTPPGVIQLPSQAPLCPGYAPPHPTPRQNPHSRYCCFLSNEKAQQGIMTKIMTQTHDCFSQLPHNSWCHF